MLAKPKIIFIPTKIYLLIIGLAFASVSFAQKEVKLPFADAEFNMSSIRPLNLCPYDYAIRIYVNHGTSLDKIVTITNDTLGYFLDDSTTGLYDTEYYGNIQFIGMKYYKSGGEVGYYRNETLASERVMNLILTLQGINLYSFENRKEISRQMHTPNSSYTIELMRNGTYHTFNFQTHYPRETNGTGKYENLERDILKLFPELTRKRN